MESKNLSVLGLSILMLVVIMSSVSAFSISANNFDGNSTTLTVTTNSSDSGIVTLGYTGDLDVSFNESSFTASGVEETTYILATIQDNTDDLDYGDYSITFNATLGSDTVEATATYTKEFYDGENQGDLDVSNIEFNTQTGFGDDEDYWYPLDEIEMTFDVDNDGDWDIENVEIQFCLWDENEGKCIMDEDDVEIDDDKFDLKDGDGKMITINFQISPEDLSEDNNDYRVYVSAVGKIDDKDSDYDKDKTGDSDYQDIEIRADEDFVILTDDDLKVLSDDYKLTDIVQCGEDTKLTLNAWNIGSDKIDQDEVFVRVYSSDLKIDKVIDVDDISSLNNKEFEIELNIPEDLNEGWYKIELTVCDDEDCSNSDVYENSEDDKAVYSFYIKVEGNCGLDVSDVNLVTSLESGGKAGEELVIKATIVNSGSKLATYTLNANGYNDWASVVAGVPSTVIVEAGSQKDVLMTFKVNSDVSGEKELSILLLSEGEVAVTQPLKVEIEKSGFTFPFTGNVISDGNWYLWGIGALNVILVIIIILVAIRVARK